MRFSKRWVLAGLVGFGCIGLRGELQQWVQWMPAGALQSVFFQAVTMPGGTGPGGTVNTRRPPAETRPALASRIFDEPNQPELYRLRAHEDELQLDFVAAEEDWRKYTQMSGNTLELADYYHRRLRPKDELAALETLTKTPSERWTPVTEQAAWRAFERMLALSEEQGFPEADLYREWIARYPNDMSVRQRTIGFLVSKGLYADAATQISEYQKLFPMDVAYPVAALASIEVARGAVDQAIAVYDGAFQPLWPDDVMAGYFKLLDDQGKLRDFLARNRVAIAANPEDLGAATRLFAYYQHGQNAVAAGRVLIEFRLNKESRHLVWNATELFTLAQLFEKAGDMNESARCYYALYRLPGAGDAAAEQAIGGLTGLLLNHPDQPIRFGSGDLSFYKDIATMDRSPGFLNGILSLLLNGTGPRWEYQQQDQKAALYFHRASAAELLALLDRRFPRSASRDPLHATMIDAYAQYGDNEAVIQAGREYLDAFPTSAHRLTVAMLMADALARLNRTTEEYALYEQLLKELAAKADGVPLGGPGTAARAPDYQKVLDRYISRLTANQGPVDVLKLYRREIDHNPSDPGLYERFAGFLEANRMYQDADQVYRQAIQKLNDKGWYTSLARFYIRQKESAQITDLTREVTKIFSGSELERYFTDAVAEAPLDAVLYRQVNLYAHERFPDDMVFVRNLLNAYQRRETRDTAAYTSLLRNYWFYDAQLKAEFFAEVSRQRQLTAEMDAVQKAPATTAAQMFLAEGEAWQSHFEASAPYFRRVAGEFPGDKSVNERAASVYRSLATIDASQTEAAVSLQKNVVLTDPRDSEALARIGDIYMDREELAKAKPFWERIPTLEPGNSGGFLDAATVFWDYYDFDDALRMIEQARGKFHDRALFAYQAGAIDEGKREYQPAVREYVTSALAGNSDAERRLMQFARRPAQQAVVDAATVPSDVSLAALNLRIAVLNAQTRRADLETLLGAAAASSHDLAVLTRVEEVSRQQGFDDVVQHAMEREIEISGDPVEKMQLLIGLARYFEGKKNLQAARATIMSLYRDDPQILGVVRATVDFYTRLQEPKPAVAALLAAAKIANSTLRREFTLEAARKAEESGDYEGSRAILAEILKTEPNAADALALLAATYSAAGDDVRFKRFSLDSIAALKKAPLTADERNSRIAALRRGLIPSLTRTQDFSGAVEQYIEVINRYPEDAGLTDEASSYDIQHLGNAQQLLAFYQKTVADAPRDYRWPIVLARIETDAEDFPAAIAAYTKALEDRPDRRGVLESRARLEERLMRFDEAEASYRRLYELSYHDPQWMLKAGETCAREGKTQQAVAAVQQAVAPTGAETAEELFDGAVKLEAWELIPQAAEFAERGAQLAGDALYEKPGFSEGAVEYLKLETRMRRYEKPYDRMIAAMQKQAGEPQARVFDFWSSFQAMGQVAGRYFTPEQKLALAKFLEAREGDLRGPEVELANAAGLQDLRVKWMLERGDPQFSQVQMNRARFEELGTQMEALAKKHENDPPERIRYLDGAARAYGLEGDDASELRVLGAYSLGSEPSQRYLALLAKSKPENIIELARGKSDAAANFAEQHGDAAFALRAVSARGETLTPVWNKAYAALTGLYYLLNTGAIDQAFVGALGDQTIGERIGKPVDREQQLAGNVWFYYGSRYGEYLAAFQKPASEDFLPSGTEAAPGNADAYFQLGDFYQSAHEPAQAVAEFERVLQLHPDSGMADNRIAECLWVRGRHADAIARWRAALAKMQRVQSRGVAVPADFWQTVTAIIADIGTHKVLAQLRPAIRSLLLDYMNRNRDYQLEPLLAAAMQASLDAGGDIGWVIDVASQSVNAEGALSTFQRLPGLTAAQLETLARDLLSVADHNAAEAYGDGAIQAIADRDQKWLELVNLLLDQKKTASAEAEWARLSSATQAGAPSTEMRLAAQMGTVTALIASYKKQPETAPPLQPVLETATLLRNTGDAASALLLLDFAYSRELEGLHYDESNFLGLASVRLGQGNTDVALVLLHRMNLIAGQPFETFIPAADLLLKFGKKQEATTFLEARARAVPWDADTKLRLGQFASLVGNDQAAYSVRLRAAEGIGKPLSSDSGELNAIAAGTLTPAKAEHPYYVRSRVLAAERTANGPAKFRMLRDALAIDPDDTEIRRLLGLTAISQRHDRFGVSVAEPLLTGPASPEQATLAIELSGAEERLGNPERALQFTQIALQDSLDERQRRLWKARSAALQAVVNLRAANNARKPEIHEALEQDHPVRPMLAARRTK